MATINIKINNPYAKPQTTIDANLPTKSNVTVKDVIEYVKKHGAMDENSILKKCFVLTDESNKILKPSQTVVDTQTFNIRRITTVLDIDETLIHALTVSEMPANLDTSNHLTFVMDDNKDPDPYVIIARPGLYKFLDTLFKHSKVCIWTAASQDYATWIINNVLSKDASGNTVHRELPLSIFSNHCDISYDVKDGHKVLSCFFDEFKLPDLDPVDFNENDIFVLFDDSKAAYTSNKREPQIHKCFRIKAFEVEDDGTINANDTALAKASEPFTDPVKMQKFLSGL